MSSTPALHGLASLACADTSIAALGDHRDDPQLAITAPDAARPFVVSCLSEVADAPILVVSANGREADDLTAELRELLDDESAVAQFPSWETLPHERLSPSAEVVGQRLEVLHRLAHPGDAPLRVVVTTVRSLVQPMAPGLGEIRTMTLREGIELDFDGLLTDLVEMAYERVDMVGRRGEFAVRGGILDVFPTTADFPVRVEFWGDEISEMRAFSVADQRSQPEVDASVVLIHPCRELLLTPPVRERAAELAVENADDPSLVEMLTSLAEGIPVAGMEALTPALVDGEMQLLTEVLPAGTRVLVLDPEKVRTRAADLAQTGAEFLEASWNAAAMGATAPVDTRDMSGPTGIDLQASAYRPLDDVEKATLAAGRSWWTMSPLSAGFGEEYELDITPGPTPHGDDEEIRIVFAGLRAHVSAGNTAAIVVAGKGTAQRVCERLADAEVPHVLADEGARGLTHRAVDAAAGTPRGTASNYFPSRDELIAALVERIEQRLTPDPDAIPSTASRRPDAALFADYVRDVVRRLGADPHVSLALFELRLEAARHAGIIAALSLLALAPLRRANEPIKGIKLYVKETRQGDRLADFCKRVSLRGSGDIGH